MTDFAAPAAPAAPAPTNGAAGPTAAVPQGKAPSPGAPVAAKPQATPGHPTRGPDGKFAPKPNQEAAPVPAKEGESKPSETQAQAEARRLRAKVKIFGKEEELDLSEEEAIREIQKGRALERKTKANNEQADRARRAFELAQKDPVAFLRELGHDVNQLAERQLAERARMEMMTPEQRALAERDAKIAEYEQREQTRQQSQRAEAAKRHEQMLLDRNRQEFAEAVEKHGIPKNYKWLERWVDVKRHNLEQGLSLNPEQIASEARKSARSDLMELTHGLQGKSLMEFLGPELVQHVLQQAIAGYEAEHTYEPPAATRQQPMATGDSGPREVLSEADVNQRLRAFKL